MTIRAFQNSDSDTVSSAGADSLCHRLSWFRGAMGESIIVPNLEARRDVRTFSRCISMSKA
jgi:hypothetical protein